MVKYLLGILVKEIVEAITKAISDYIALRQKKKEDKQKVEDAIKEKDPQARAAAIRDLLS